MFVSDLVSDLKKVHKFHVRPECEANARLTSSGDAITGVRGGIQWKKLGKGRKGHEFRVSNKCNYFWAAESEIFMRLDECRT